MARSTWVGCWSEPITSHTGDLVPGGDDHPCPSALWLASVTHLIQTWCATSCGRTLKSPGLLTSPQPLWRVHGSKNYHMIQQFHFSVFFSRIEETLVTKHICVPLFTEALFTAKGSQDMEGT